MVWIWAILLRVTSKVGRSPDWRSPSEGGWVALGSVVVAPIVQAGKWEDCIVWCEVAAIVQGADEFIAAVTT